MQHAMRLVEELRMALTKSELQQTPALNAALATTTAMNGSSVSASFTAKAFIILLEKVPLADLSARSTFLSLLPVLDHNATHNHTARAGNSLQPRVIVLVPCLRHHTHLSFRRQTLTFKRIFPRGSERRSGREILVGVEHAAADVADRAHAFCCLARIALLRNAHARHGRSHGLVARHLVSTPLDLAFCFCFEAWFCIRHVWCVKTLKVMQDHSGVGWTENNDDCQAMVTVMPRTGSTTWWTRRRFWRESW